MIKLNAMLLSLLLLQILFIFSTGEKLDCFTVWEEYTIKCSYRSMELYHGDNFIFEAQDTMQVIDSALKGLETCRKMELYNLIKENRAGEIIL